jgi:acyl-CoA thioester hydrolase
VRYAETDRMGYVYYGNYSTYFEVARVEALRSLGVSYKSLEDEGIMLPVLEYRIKYFKPAFYDDLLRIETVIDKLPSARIHFSYKTFQQDGTQVNEAETTLIFVDVKTGKPIAAPEHILEKFREYFE